jgi:hypothetical protein
VRKGVDVQAPPEVAWRMFGEVMGTWWQLATYTISKANAVDAVIEAWVGARWYERGDDGSTSDWAASSRGKLTRAWIHVRVMTDVTTGQRYTHDFPLSKAGLLEWSFIPLQVPLPIETLFRDAERSLF